MPTQFYSYLWLREDGTPYYAGKGCGNRAFRRAKHYQNPPTAYSRILIFPMLNEAEAFESEMAMIELFGRKDNGTGCLRNVTNGGEGLAGHRHSQKTREKMKQSAQEQRNRGRRYPCLPETAKKISTALAHRQRPPFSAEWKAKLKAAAQIRAARPAERIRMAANLAAQRERDFIKTVAWG